MVPVLDYGSCVWGYGNFEKVNSVQNRAIRLFLGVHKFTSNLAINGDMGWVSSKIRRYLCILRFYNRLINMQEDRLAKKVFNRDKNNVPRHLRRLAGCSGADYGLGTMPRAPTCRGAPI